MENVVIELNVINLDNVNDNVTIEIKHGGIGRK